MDAPGRMTKLRQQKKINRIRHSCLTCRQRKVRCTFNRGDQSCLPCLKRGLPCNAQENAEPTPSKNTQENAELTPSKEPNGGAINTDERLSNIENLLDKLLARIEERNDATPIGKHKDNGCTQLKHSIQVIGQTSLPSPLDSELATSSDHVEPPASAPIFNLFDNAILRRGQTSSNAEAQNLPRTQHKSYTPHVHQTLVTLRDSIPSPLTLLNIVSSSTISLEFWEELIPDIQLSTRYASKDLQNRAICETLQLWLSSDSIGFVLKAALGLALCMQQSPDNNVCGGFSSTSEEQYVRLIDTILLSDEAFLYTIDGIECLVLEANFYVNLGKPQKAWLLLQRALNHSHLLGLHRLTTASKHITTIWMKAWIWEKQLSLMLGIPSASLNKVPIIEKVLAQPDTPHEHRLCLTISEIGGRVIDRNRNTPEQDLDDTIQLEQDLKIWKNSFPSDFWDGPVSPEVSRSKIEYTFLAKIMYHIVRKLAHLPFMVRALTDMRFEYNRNVTLGSSRELLRLFQGLHDSKAITAEICNVLDFQIFTAAMVLVVNVLASNLPDTNEADLEAIRQITDLFEKISTRRGCIVATQASKVLRDFLIICNDDESKIGDIYEVTIPYFGRIRVSCHRKRQVNKPIENRDQFNGTGLYGNELEFSDIFLTPEIYHTDWTMNNELDLESNWAWF